jgi:hypothetical protein
MLSIFNSVLRIEKPYNGPASRPQESSDMCEELIVSELILKRTRRQSLTHTIMLIVELAMHLYM